MNEATNKGYSIWLDNYYNLKNNCFNSRKCSHKAKTIKIDFEIDKKSFEKSKRKKLIFFTFKIKFFKEKK
jgi:hypothetical protein